MASANRASTRKRVKADVELEQSEDVNVLEASGFKFSRQSRYRKGKGSATKSARKKRRSSFVRGRKDRKSLLSTPAASAKSELYKDIPKDLPPEERLTKLFDACLEGALKKLDSEPSKYHVDGILNFSDEAKKVFNHLRQRVSHIVQEELKPDNKSVKMIPNPRNEELEGIGATQLTACERLRTENEKWEKVLSSHQKLLENTERDSQKDESVNVTDQCPDFLSPEQHQLLSGKPSLKGLMEKLDDMKQTAILQVDKVSQAVNTIKQYEEVCRGYVNEQMNTFGSTTFEAIQEAGTPRTMIRGHLKNL